MKNFYVIAVKQGSKFAKDHIFLINPKGESLKVNRNFAKANGIDESFTGAVIYDQISVKKGDKYLDAQGKEALYLGDGKKVTSIIAVTNAAYNKAEAETIIKLQYKLLTVNEEA